MRPMASRFAVRVLFPLVLLLGAAPAVTRAHDGHHTPFVPGLDPIADTLAVVEVRDSFERNLARIGAASQGTVTRAQITARPYRRAGEVLENVPGVVVSQHSGEGKANQYYLRGFNLDHGTDFATTVAGVPVNLPSHGHGHGYSDLSFVLPEVVGGIQYRKGPYYADEGDFASAGASNITYRNALDRPIVGIAGDAFGLRRLVAAGSRPLGEAGGSQLLAAGEFYANDGPWDRPDDARRLNGLLRWSRTGADGGLSVTLSGYDGKWNASDQVPERAVDAGTLGRFGAVDLTDGGASSRYALSGEWQDIGARDTWRASAYVVDYALDLFSNFTYALDDTVNGDQFEQGDRRMVYGVSSSWTRGFAAGGRPVETTLGASARLDAIDRVGLYATRARERLDTVREDDVREGTAGLYGQAVVQWSRSFRSTLGLRGDAYRFDVASDDPRNSGVRNAGVASPKLSLLFGPYGRTAFFANAGLGHHSNDARGTTITVDPKTGDAAGPVDPVVRTRGAELGVRTAALTNVSASFVAWGLGSDSELLFVGDAGTTEPSRPSRRLGVETEATWRPTTHVVVDAQMSWSRARFTDDAPEGDRVPGAVEGVIAAGVSGRTNGALSGGARLRWFGPRDLIEDGSVRSAASTLVSAHAAWKFPGGIRVGLEALNLFDSRSSDIDYFYASRLPGEPAAGIDDIHFHPVEPFTLRFTVGTGSL